MKKLKTNSGDTSLPAQCGASKPDCEIAPEFLVLRNAGTSATLDSTRHLAIHFSPTDRLLSFRQVQEIIPISKTRAYELQATGEFPRPIKISRQRVAWLESEIFAYLNARIEQRNKKYSFVSVRSTDTGMVVGKTSVSKN